MISKLHVASRPPTASSDGDDADRPARAPRRLPRDAKPLQVEAPKGEFSFPPFLEAKVDVTTKHWFSSSAHDSYARTMMLAGEVASDPFDGDANADPRRGAW